MKIIGIYMKTVDFHWKIVGIYAESCKTSINHANQPEITQMLANSLKSKQNHETIRKSKEVHQISGESMRNGGNPSGTMKSHAKL